MNLKSLVYFSLVGFATISGNAQNASDVLLKVNDTPFTVGEFERIYTKNIDLIKDSEQKDIDNYLDLFITYKLKVQKAYDLGLDKNSNHINEYNTHKEQLADQYLTNQETLDKLAKEAYERSIYEIKASHIIFLADQFATPADTLKAYNKAIEVRNEILNGKNFEEAAVEYSEDPSSKENKGNLGYFSVLRMVYPFESGAYNTPVGEISMPIRSEYGYHLIKVNDKRIKQGKRSIAQIFVDGKDDVVVSTSKKRIDEVYDLLLKGESFEDLVVTYSDDLTSKSNQGKFGNYEPGLISIDNLDDEVYKLKKVGDFSKPFQSKFGWHIVKLNSEDAIPTFEDRKAFYLRKVQSDSRSRIITNELVAHLKQNYKFKENKRNLLSFVKFIENNVDKQDYLLNLKTNKELASFSDKKIYEKDFVKFIDEKGANFKVISPIASGVEFVFNDFISEEILNYYRGNLNNEFPEFKNITQEFKEGLLLFDLMENEIWHKVKNDSVGYTNFYNSNLNEFYKPEAVKGIVFSSNKKSDLNKVQKFYQKNFSEKNLDLKHDFTSKSIVSNQGMFNNGDTILPNDYVLAQGVSKIFEQNGKYYLVVASEYYPERNLEVDEVKQNVIYKYQEVFEGQWLNDLKRDSKIEINQPVLNQLKAKYKQN